jgi:uncharacterized protein with NRDE domain
VCTLLIASHVFDDSPLYLASNRDERLDRPASGPVVWNHRSPPLVAPRDEQEGGTWLGVNADGVLSAITNRFGSGRDAAKRSRGELVLIALQASTAGDAAETIAALPAEDFNPFHLALADADSAHVVWTDEKALHHEVLPPGMHVITERSFGAAENGRADRLRRRLDALDETGSLSRESLTELLRERRVDDLDCTCVLVPEMNYGTRSSALVDLGESPRFLFSEGPPCEADYEDYSILLRDVLR